MTELFGQVQSGLRLKAVPNDPLAELREALLPLVNPAAAGPSPAMTRTIRSTPSPST